MTALKLISLYDPQPNDIVVDLIDSNGFSLVCEYPEGRVDSKIFLRLYIADEIKLTLGGSVNRVSATESKYGGGYTILDTNAPEGRVTNFILVEEDGFTLDGTEVRHKNLSRTLTLEEFVYFLVKNHVDDNLGPMRRRQYIAEKILKVSFWLVDLKYRDFKIYSFEPSLRTLLDAREATKQPEPFLKYFHIPRNMLGLTIMTAALVISIYYLSFYIDPNWTIRKKLPDITNFSVVIYAAATFVIMEIIAGKINSAINSLNTEFKTWLGRQVAIIHGFHQEKIKLDFNLIPKKKA